jgi:lipoate-protein ligase B
MEHPPVYTAGRATQIKDLSEKTLHEIIEVERGGSVTFHGPGQLVGYLIFDLRLRGRDVHQFLRDVEKIIVRTLAKLGLVGLQRDGLTGIWVNDEKVASLGIHVSKWITSHGFSLNIDMDLAPFRLINPCGQDGRLVTSLRNLLQRDVQRQEVETILIEQAQGIFGESVLFGPELTPFIEEENNNESI